MDYRYNKLQTLKLQPRALPCMFCKILEMPCDNVCCVVPFYRSRRKQVLNRIAALKNVLEKSQKGL